VKDDLHTVVSMIMRGTLETDGSPITDALPRGGASRFGRTSTMRVFVSDLAAMKKARRRHSKRFAPVEEVQLLGPATPAAMRV